MYVVDTDVSIDYMKGIASAVNLINSLENMHITTITIAELFFGAYNSPKAAKHLPVLFNYVKGFDRLTPQLWDAIRFGKIKAELTKRGAIIGDQDIFNASIALSYGFIFVTRNVRHYSRIKGLKLMTPQ
mgnify:CR=1 FL=1